MYVHVRACAHVTGSYMARIHALNDPGSMDLEAGRAAGAIAGRAAAEEEASSLKEAVLAEARESARGAAGYACVWVHVKTDGNVGRYVSLNLWCAAGRLGVRRGTRPQRRMSQSAGILPAP